MNTNNLSMDKNSSAFVEEHLLELWRRLNLDMPNNWDDILNFVIEDVASASGYSIDGDFHSGDIEIPFRRFIESRSEV